LKDSPVISQIHSPIYYAEHSPMIYPRMFGKVPVQEEEFKVFFNPLNLANSLLLIDHLVIVGDIPKKQPPCPPPPPRVFNKETSRYAPLNIPRNLHDFPHNYLKLLPKCNG